MALALAAPAGAAQPVLREGSTGPLVAAWQHVLGVWLADSGYPATRHLRNRLGPLAADGVFGPQTEAATLRFQREARIPATGHVDLRTWVRWIGADVTCCGAGYRAVGLGDQDAYVGWWQLALGRWLAFHHLGTLIVDCIFGPRTAAATSLFQRHAHLPATGAAGPATWTALNRRKPGAALG